MKSYFKFLSRNQAYALVNVAGMTLSFAFVILVIGYAWQEWHVDSQYSRLSNMYVIASRASDGHLFTSTNWRVQDMLQPEFSEIVNSVSLRKEQIELTNDRGEKVSTLALMTDASFSEFFEQELVAGSWTDALANKNGIVVTDQFAKRAFGDEAPVGKNLRLTDDVSLVVTAVMQPIINSSLAGTDSAPIDAIMRFEMMEYIDWWAFSPQLNQLGGTEIVLMSADGVDLADRAALYQQRINESGYRQFTEAFGNELVILPLRGFYLSDVSSPNLRKGSMSMVMFLSVVGGVLLVFALMNYINMTVAQASRRAKEMAERRLLGASHKSIVMRLIAESSVLCGIALVLAIGVAFLAAPYLGVLLDAQIHLALCFTPVTVAALVAVWAVASMAAGLAPAIAMASVKPIDIVRGAYRRKAKMLFTKVFIVVQNSITIIMIGCTLTLALQYAHMVNAPLGYDYQGVMMVPGGDQAKNRVMVRELASLPCVETVAVGSSMPLYGGHNNTMVIDDKVASIQLFWVDENWMKVFKIEPESDNHYADGWFVNHKLLADQGLKSDAAYFKYGENNSNPQRLRGVLPDFKLGSADDNIVPHLMIKVVKDLLSDTSNGNGAVNFFVRVKGDAAEAYQQVLDLYYDVYDVHIGDGMPFVDQIIRRHFAALSRMSQMVGLFALVALLISVMGLTAMGAYFVQQRSLEIAIRKVNGDTSAGVIKRILRPFVAYVAVAFVIAVPCIYVLMNAFLAQISYRIEVYWWIYALAGAICLAVAIVGVLLQTRRAANANPVKALYQN